MTESLEKIDPGLMPYRTLYTGAKIPCVGLGTFGSDRFTASEIPEAVLGAAQIGYRHFDCAAAYGNEKEIGVSPSARNNEQRHCPRRAVDYIQALER